VRPVRNEQLDCSSIIVERESMAAKRKKRNPGSSKSERKPAGDAKKSTTPPAAAFRPVPPVGEGDDNLAKREEWFRRRTGAN
jgi:hypothetical protein